jgi:MinD-like ATPase involved in chromosome partitioning or flagellar assembly
VPKRSVIVTGSKAGVGTTTVALKLAVHMAQQMKKRVGLIEFARPFGQISLRLDFDPRFTLLDALERIDRLEAPLLASLVARHKTGVEILAGPLHAALRAEQRQLVTIEALLRILELARATFDLMVIDLEFVNAAEWARVLQSADTLVLVAEPRALALDMLERYLKAVDLAGLHRDRFQIIISRRRQNDDEPITESEKNLKQSFFARLPNDFRQVSEAVTPGIRLTDSSNNPLVGRYRDLAARLMMIQTLEGASRTDSPVAVGQKQTQFAMCEFSLRILRLCGGSAYAVFVRSAFLCALRVKSVAFPCNAHATRYPQAAATAFIVPSLRVRVTSLRITRTIGRGSGVSRLARFPSKAGKKRGASPHFRPG